MAEDYVARYRKVYALYQAHDYAAVERALNELWENTHTKTMLELLLAAYNYRAQHRYTSEIAVLEELVRLFAHDADSARLADAYSMLGAAYRTVGEARAAVAAFLRSAELEERPRQRLAECSNAIFAASGAADYTAAEFAALYARYRGLLAELNITPYERMAYGHKRLRIGYLSADLHAHPVADYVGALLTGYDSENFAVYVYDIGTQHDSVTARLRAGGAIWRELAGADYATIAAAIRADEVDVLVELGGHTAGNALPVLAYRPAPVELCGIGYFNSTGIPECDGFIADIYTAPEAHSPFFVEPLVRLPATHFCYQPQAEFPPVAPATAAARRGFVTFGCFNNLAKVTDEMLALWRELLARVPRSRLLLKHQLVGSPEGRALMLARLERAGISAERVELRGFSPDYRRDYYDVDIALDTYPYPGGATTCEALCMGVPVVTLRGERHGARFGYSFLANIGLAELAAVDAASYVDIAAGLATDRELLTALHTSLRGLMERSPLMDASAYTRAMEALYCERYALFVASSGRNS